MLKLKSAILNANLIVALVLIVLSAGCGASTNTTLSTTASPFSSTTGASATSTSVTVSTAASTTANTATEIASPTQSPPTTPSPASTTASQTPTPTPSASAPPFPTTVYRPAAAPYVPSGALTDLFKYALELINQDRADQNLAPVELAYNAAAQKHAQDMLDNNYVGHWGTDGLKPYMRYTAEGGYNYEQENSAYTSGNKKINPKTEIKALEYAMVYDDAASNWGHRDNIWNKLHKKVSLGLAYDEYNLALVQQFEGEYLEFYQPPTLKGNILSLSGHFTLEGLTLNNAAITFDALPQPLSGAELAAGPYHSYGLGARVGQIFAPPPPGAQYSNLPANSVVAEKGLVEDAVFWLEADISTFLAGGPGVYTVCLIGVLDGQPVSFSNYSILVK